MTIQQRISHLSEVGNFLRLLSENGDVNSANFTASINELYDKIQEQIDLAVHHNGWFTRENILFSLQQWSQALTEINLKSWVHAHHLEPAKAKTVAIIMAGNIPMVGFHDFISVLISGNHVLVKQSSNDQNLLPLLAQLLITIEPEYQNRISFAQGKLQDFDAVIATGSNNTARYFEYYFASKPSIIRKNRNSIAVLTGKETTTELLALGTDIFRYFGLGCRNVSKLYIPENYDFHAFYQALAPWEELLNHAKYANNYDYNKAVYLMSEFKFLDNGFLLLKKEEKFGSPIATLFYDTYSKKESLLNTLENNRSQLQCIVSRGVIANEIAFGESQKPQLWDFADNVNTLSFLAELE